MRQLIRWYAVLVLMMTGAEGMTPTVTLSLTERTGTETGTATTLPTATMTASDTATPMKTETVIPPKQPLTPTVSQTLIVPPTPSPPPQGVVFDPLNTSPLNIGDQITIWPQSPTAAVHFTLDSRAPIIGSPFTYQYTAPITVNSSMLQANGSLLVSVITVEGQNQSEVTQMLYGVNDVPAAPVITGVSQRIFTIVTITGNLSAGSEIRYTQDGTVPTVGSPLYTDPFLLPTGMFVVQAIVVDTTTMSVSEVAEETFIIVPPVEPPSFSVQNTEQLNTTSMITITSPDVGVLIYFVLCDGLTGCAVPLSPEAANSTEQFVAGTPLVVAVEGNYSLSAIAWLPAAGQTPSRSSEVSVVSFSVKDVIAPPRVSPPAGEYLAPLQLSFTAAHTQPGIDRVTYSLNGSAAETKVFPSPLTVDVLGPLVLTFSVEGSETVTESYVVFPPAEGITGYLKGVSPVTEDTIKSMAAVAVGTTPDNVAVSSIRPSSDPDVTIVEFSFNSTDSALLTERALSPTSSLRQDFTSLYLTSVGLTPSPDDDNDFPLLWVIIGGVVLCLLIVALCFFCRDGNSSKEEHPIGHTEELMKDFTRSPTPPVEKSAAEKTDPAPVAQAIVVEKDASDFGERAATPPVMPPVTTVTGSYQPPAQSPQQQQQQQQQATFESMELIDPDSPTLLHASPHRPRDDWAPPCVAVRPLHEFCQSITHQSMAQTSGFQSPKESSSMLEHMYHKI